MALAEALTFGASTSTTALVGRALAVLVVFALVRFFYRLCQVRLRVRAATANGIAALPHSFLLGHLPVVAKVMSKYPRDLYSGCIPHAIMLEYPKLQEQGAFYFDMWPITHSMLVVAHPDLMVQYHQDTVLPKHPLMKIEFGPLTGLQDLVNMGGEQWKRWRGMFNPGFSAKNLLSLMPWFLEEIDPFVERLRTVATTGEIISLDETAMNVTIDIVGRAVLGTRLHSQTTINPMKVALLHCIGYLQTSNAPHQLAMLCSPLRYFHLWNNNRIIRNYLAPLIQGRMRQDAAEAADNKAADGPKTVVSLALTAYRAEAAEHGVSPSEVDATFVDMLVSQIKIFLFAGHDTTATGLSFTYHLLHRHPDKLALARAELDAVLGPDPATARAKIAAQPGLLNQLPYLAGVIREGLRLFPPVGTVREGQPGFELTDPVTRARYATENFMLFSVSFSEHRLEQFWPRANEFLPERWLAREGEPLHVRKNAFRPFEIGPRNCIGQELAQLELRAILALTLREFDVETVFAEDAPEFMGDKAYLYEAPWAITGHTKDGMPARVRMRGGKSG